MDLTFDGVVCYNDLYSNRVDLYLPVMPYPGVCDRIEQVVDAKWRLNFTCATFCEYVLYGSRTAITPDQLIKVILHASKL